MDLSNELTSEILFDLYQKQGLTETEIANRYCTYQGRIGRLRRKWGIPTMTQGQRVTLSLPPVTAIQHQVLIGSLLGDGCVGDTSEESARFQEGHCKEQQPYLEWKANILGPYVSSTYDIKKVDPDGKVFHGRGFTTKSCPAFRPYFDLFYPAPKRERQFPGSLSDEMTPLVLAVWYMDDGRLNGYHPEISFGLDEVSLRRAVRALRRLGFKPGLYGETSSDMMLTFPGQVDQFFDLVGPHIPSCMQVKVPDHSERRDKDRNAKKLTPQRVKELYVGGLSFVDIAETHHVGVSTVHRRLKSVGVEARKMGRIRKSYSRIAAEVVLGNYDPSLWPTLTVAEQDAWVNDIYDVLSKSEFPYPRLVESKFQTDLQRLLGLKVTCNGTRIEPWTPIGCAACAPFFPNRFKASAGRSESAFVAWHREEKLKYAIRFQLKQGDPVLPHRVLSAVTMQHRTPSIFRPSVAKFIYQTYCQPGGLVWDPCTGYGGRLLGAYAAGVQYIGTDVESQTVEGNQKLALQLGYPALVHCHPAETFNPPKVDLVFTSPPYFDRERYSTNEGQSWVRYGDTIVKWVDGFLRPVIQTSMSVLPTGGRLVLNIADLYVNGRLKVPLVSLTTEAVLGVGFHHEATLEMPLSGLNREKPHEPVLVFQKP